MALQTTNCDRVRLQALDGTAYGAVISPDKVGDDLYATTTQWLVLGGVQSGQILSTAEVEANYADYTDSCIPIDALLTEEGDPILTEEEEPILEE